MLRFQDKAAKLRSDFKIPHGTWAEIAADAACHTGVPRKVVGLTPAEQIEKAYSIVYGPEIAAPADFTDLCMSRTDNCENIGGRCYFMAVMTFLIKAAAELQAAGVVSPTMTKVLNFAHWMTSCKVTSDRLATCQKLPDVIRATYQKYLDHYGSLEKASADPGVVLEGGHGDYLLQACFDTAVGGLEYVNVKRETVYGDDENGADDYDTWAPLVVTPKTQGVVVAKWEYRVPPEPLTVAAMKEAILTQADEITAAAADRGATIKVLGGVVDMYMQGGVRNLHQTAFNLCGPKRKIMWCDPNAKKCFPLSKHKYVETYFAAHYGGAMNITWVAVWV